jgi:Zn-finger nucleic acid-binding protein
LGHALRQERNEPNSADETIFATLLSPIGNLRGLPPHQLQGRKRHISTLQQCRKDRLMKCPIDGATLVISDRSGVEIDYCPECRGVWLDRGELDKIIERSAVAATPPPAPRDTRGGHDDYRPRKKRESFLSELFDF